MKVALVINELDIMGGTHKQLVRLCQYLENKNVEFTIFTKKYLPEKTYSELTSYNIVCLKTKKKSRFINSGIIGRVLSQYEESKALSKLISDEYDIINVHDNGLLSLIKKMKKKRKIVVWQINDLPGEFRVGNAKGVEIRHRWLNECSKKRIVSISQKVDAITVNVTKNQERVNQYLNKDALVFYCGVDVNDNFENHSPICGDEIKLLSTGVFFPYRNYESLVEVVHVLRQKGYHVSLDIIGSTQLDEEYSSKVQKMIDELKLSDCIKIWGQVDNETYNRLYNESNIFLFMNIDQSWGLTVFEAMSAGIPTLVSNSVGAIELLHNEDDSIILDPKNITGICNKIIQLYEDKNYYLHISENGKNVVKEFTWDNLYSSKMLDLFKKLYKEKGAK